MSGVKIAYRSDLTAVVHDVKEAFAGYTQLMRDKEMYAPWPPNALAGMPYRTSGFGTPGVTVADWDGPSILVTWASEPDGDVDGDVWERIPLSRYYAIVEANPDGGEAA